MSASFFEKSAAVLEWDRVIETLAGLARSVMGAERCRALVLETEVEAARTRMRETGEIVALSEEGDPFPSISFSDVRDALLRVAKGAGLEPHDLRDISVALGIGADLTAFLSRRQERVPALWAAASSLEPFGELRQVKVLIDRAVDAEGNIRESATPELRRLSQHAHDLKQRMRDRLAVILESRRYAEVLQEHYFAQREGRYVVPIKAEMRGRIPGIVHDVSASGATVFLEPRELVELNNSIKVAGLEVDREVRRILRELSTAVAEHKPAIEHVLGVLADFDCIAAKAALSHLVKGKPVSLNESGRIVLRQARHPLLVLSREHVVPNDLQLDETLRALVISGPNTGGKTVTLKTVGLFALMVRAGLHVSCAPDSEMAVFPDIFADIGDPQDLARDLSSFSAHMTQMIGLLRHAGADSVGGAQGATKTLVLLDELVTSTDPTEGAALAEALLVELTRQNLKVVVTTHYNALKLLAQTTPGFANASLEFDVSTLSPTYRLIMGVPGGSSAIEIAGRLGLDDAILEHALKLIKREDRLLEQVLEDLQEKQRRLHQDEETIAALKTEAEESAREAREIADRLRASEREEKKGMKRKLTEDLLRARAEVQAILEELKRDRTLIKAKEAKRQLAEVDTRVSARLGPTEETIPVEQLDAGGHVEIGGLGTTGVLLEAVKGRRRVRVRVGDREVSVAVSQLVGLGHGAEQPHREQRGSPPRRPAIAEPAPVETDQALVVDLRGKTAEDALDETVKALDQAAMGGLPWIRLIHGHGTGRLKATLREYLTSSPYVARFRAGVKAEGGDGVTIVELR